MLLNEEFATRRYIDRYCQQLGIAPRIAMEVNSISAVIEFIQRGTLAPLLPAAIAREHSELYPVDLESALPQRTAAMLLRKGAYRSAATKAFVALALEECAARMDAERTPATSQDTYGPTASLAGYAVGPIATSAGLFRRAIGPNVDCALEDRRLRENGKYQFGSG